MPTIPEALARPAADWLAADGYALHVRALGAAALRALEDALSGSPRGVAGVRLRGVPALAPVLATGGAIGTIAANAIGLGAMPVRAILFDKGPGNNWALGWHQDRTIAVRRRVEVPGYGPWTRKAGMPHVAPPVALLARMVTVRVHLDPIGPDNAPLLVAPGSHRLGLVAEPDVLGAVARCGTAACHAARGDAWVYATLILHASGAAARPGRRRVLQVDYSADELPGGLEWLGV